jgi:hypothetical protein
MRRSTFAALAAVAPVAFLIGGCSGEPTATEAVNTSQPAVAFAKEDAHAGAIVAHDSCEPTSFNEAIGPGTCVKNGSTTFGAFIAELTATQQVRDWRFTPEQLTARLGVNLLGNNVGGEEHTFTPVKAFGGGFIQFLNQLSGTPVPAPECLSLDEDDLVPSGGKYLIESEELAEAVDGSGIARVQCCVHPWMRSTVRMTH